MGLQRAVIIFLPFLYTRSLLAISFQLILSTSLTSFHKLSEAENGFSKFLCRDGEPCTFERAKKWKPNCVLSPLSLQVMLNLVAAASKGSTLEQLLLHLGSESIEDLNQISSKTVALTHRNKDNNSSASPVVSLANGVWVDQEFSLKPSFRRLVEGVYKAKAEEVDFSRKADEVINEVNLWVENTTNGLIKNLLPTSSLDENTCLVFVNAIYFKGAWNKRFDKTRTKKGDFRLLNGEVVQVPFMSTYRNERNFYGSFDGYKILKVPYQSGEDTSRFSMFFFLPNEVGGLPQLLEKFISFPGFLSQDFKLWEEDVSELLIPKFKFSFEIEASGAFKEVGLDRPFMKLGEYTEMVDSPLSGKIFLSQVFHKSYIEVNEEGTEAAASTAAQMQMQCARPRLCFVADHPFLFVIKEETTGTVFFTGVVLKPTLG